MRLRLRAQLHAVIKGFGIFAISAIAVTSTAWADQPSTDRWSAAPPISEMLKDVSLTPSQKAQIEAISNSEYPLPYDTMRLLYAPSLNKKAVARSGAQAAAHEQQEIDRGIEKAILVRNILNSEQIAKMSQALNRIEDIQPPADEYP